MATYGKCTNRWLFPAGTGLEEDDLVAAGVSASQRAWEVPGMAQLTAYDVPGSSGYGWVFTSAGASARIRGAFSFGGGGRTETLQNVNNIGLRDGFIGIWDETRGGPPLATDTLPRMSWIWLGSGEWSHSHAPAQTGESRYDLVHCAISKGTATTARDFEDATTGVKTTKPDAAISETLSLDIAVTSGTETGGTPTMPTLPTGRHVLYAVKVDDTGVIQRYDMVIPAGPLITAVAPARSESLGTFGTKTTYAIATQENTTCYLIPPGSLAGDENARILGFDLSHALLEGATVEVVSLSLKGTVTDAPPSGLGTCTVIGDPIDVTGSLGINGEVQNKFVHLQGLPMYTSDPERMIGPVWGSGSSKCESDRLRTIALRITSSPDEAAGGAYSKVFAAVWYAVRG